MKRHVDEALGTPAPVGQTKRAREGQWKCQGTLGSGVYGTVYAVQDSIGVQYALKLLKPFDTTKIFDYQDFVREAYGLSGAGLLRGFLAAPDYSEVGLLMPQFGPRLMGSTPIACSPEVLAWILRPVAESLASSPGMHRDVKPANIVIDVDKGRLVDYSLATHKTTSEDKGVVTLWYRAPEIIIGEPYDSKIDVWSLGITMMHLLTGALFSRVSRESDCSLFLLDVLDHLGWPLEWPQLYAYVSKHARITDAHKGRAGTLLPFLETIVKDRVTSNPDNIRLACDLVAHMCAVNPRERYSWREVMLHPFWTCAVSPGPVFGSCAKLHPIDLPILSKAQTFRPSAGPKGAKAAVNHAEPKIPSVTMLVQMDYFLYYSDAFGFTKDTAIRAFLIHCYAVSKGLRPTVTSMSACLFIAGSYNEDFRLREDLTWAHWAKEWGVALGRVAMIRENIVRVITLTDAEWPTWGLSELQTAVVHKTDLCRTYESWMLPFMACCGTPETFTVDVMESLGQTMAKMIAERPDSIVCRPVAPIAPS